MPKLDFWAILNVTSSPYQAPELGVARLTGKLSGHPRQTEIDKQGYEYGEGVVITSNLKWIDWPTRQAKTENTLYDLGDLCPNFQRYMDANEYKLEQYLDNLKKPEGLSS
jgi:hypothetical protein